MSNLIPIFATGLVSALSIPFVTYSKFTLLFRSRLCLTYLILDCFRNKKNLEEYILYLLHHISAIYLILNEGHTCREVVSSMYFLEFSSFLFQVCKYFKVGKLTAKAYWCLDRLVRFPFMIIYYKNCLNNFYVSILTLEYVGIVWTCETLKIQHKYIHANILTGLTYILT